MRPVLLRRPSLRQRIVGVVLLGEVLALMVCVVALFGLNESGSMQSRVAALSAAKRLHQHADMMHDDLRAEVYRGAHAASAGAAISERERVLEEATQLATDFQRDLESIRAIELDGRASAELERVRPILEDYIATALRYLAHVTARGSDAPDELAEFQRKFDEAAEAQDGALRAIESVEADLGTRAIAARTRAMVLVGCGGLLTFVTSIGLALFISGAIVKSLADLASVADRVVAGDLKARAAVGSGDEVAAVAASFNAMADGLTSVVDKLAYDAQRDGLGRQLNEALEMADTERSIATVVERAVAGAMVERPTELLLADSSNANLEQFAESPTAGAPGCPVRSPFNCPAVRKGSSIVFPDSGALNACPQLQGRSSGPCSAVCIPVSFMGRALGVLHSTSSVVGAADAETTAKLTTLATQVGARIGTVRAFQKTQLQAATDGLTGLINRRTFENQLRGVLATGVEVAVAIADLDRFKKLNDTAGHDAGDRALRHFARVVKQAMRSTDLVARYGGEEFVFAFEKTDREGAKVLLDRLREALAASHRGDVPPFTCSFGVTDTAFGAEVSELVAIADDALYRAKQNGRDRVEIGPLAASPSAARRASVAPESGQDSGVPVPRTDARRALRLAASGTSSVPPPR